ncbi:MAG: oxaloacetate decarboxylase subunit gamma [Syntrophomonadaceae bacterium]|jgi:Na+-transporting methylmalonyl-CoA/oxaloacetate decarboxylase gamma subunit
MASPLEVFVAGVTGVFVVMIFLQIFIQITSKVAIAIENKGKEKQNVSAKE